MKIRNRKRHPMCFVKWKENTTTTIERRDREICLPRISWHTFHWGIWFKHPWCEKRVLSKWFGPVVNSLLGGVASGLVHCPMRSCKVVPICRSLSQPRSTPDPDRVWHEWQFYEYHWWPINPKTISAQAMHYARFVQTASTCQWDPFHALIHRPTGKSKSIFLFLLSFNQMHRTACLQFEFCWYSFPLIMECRDFDVLYETTARLKRRFTKTAVKTIWNLFHAHFRWNQDRNSIPRYVKYCQNCR